MRRPFPISAERLSGIVCVLLLHALAIQGLLNHRLLPATSEALTLMVDLIAPPDAPSTTAPSAPRPVRPASPEKTVSKPLLTVNTPVRAPGDFVAPSVPAPPTESVSEAPPMPLPAGPIKLAGELALACHERPAPAYPAMSRRSGESGQVTIRVELNESGQVAAAWVDHSSGYQRLDDAALAAVRLWRCHAPMRNGQAVRALALQPFNFVLQGS